MTLQIETLFNTDSRSRFFFPGRIVEGAGMAREAIGLLQSYDRVILVVDGFFADSPLVREFVEAMGDRLLAKAVVNGSPYTQDIEEFVAGTGGAPQAILAIGGGSATDFAKAALVQWMYGRIDGVGTGALLGMAPKAGVSKPLLVSIPTTAGSGAEASRYYVTYDKGHHGKKHGRTWTVVADWILLDPAMLDGLPVELLVGCAFDAFVHYFETLIAAKERSEFGEMLSLSGICSIMGAIDQVMNQGVRNAAIQQKLLHAATFGGVAICNTRTGNIHEAAGSLLEHAELNHPETLFVFFREAIEQYADAIADRERLLLPRLHENPAFAGFVSIFDMVAWWEAVFAGLGLTDKIRARLAAMAYPLPHVKERIFERVFTDKVWVTKESPTPLSEEMVRGFIDRALVRFGLGA